ncbi:hypothetical protein Tsubulata_001820 [Turnera subulata]|uniref:PWI domain-containing protein n=1 Tax=Turnera subulata TaxID=218843 RepID=A0A9Q0G5Z0_9ROSI|nr:hypothetical protein Tsubulata_001820 [Turnera subulata]
MSGGFFRGTSADQDTRFSNKQAKLLKTQKFAPELEHLVDITKVKMDVIRPWIATRVTELLGFEDEVLINFIYGLLDGKEVNGKEVQISLTGFMEKNTVKFMKELWTLLLSAQNNESGVPQQFLDAKAEETRKKQAETDRMMNELQKKKEKESRESERVRSKKMDDGTETRAENTAGEQASKHKLSKMSSDPPKDEQETDQRNGMRGRSRNSPSRFSKTFSNSRSYSGDKQKSSRSPEAQGRSISSGRMSRSPRKQSGTPRRRHSPRPSFSPQRRRSSYSRIRSRSPSRRRSPSPSPIRSRRSPSPVRRRRSPLPIRRRRSPSPVRRRKSPTPVRRRRSPSPVRRRRSPSPIRRRRSPSPVRRRRSPSPFRRRRSPSPIRRRRSPAPIQRRRSPSPMYTSSPSPVRHRSSPSQYISPSPSQRKHQRSPSTPHHGSPSSMRRRSPVPAHKRTPASSRRSPESNSPSSERRSPSSVRRSSIGNRRSPIQSPRERVGSRGKLSPVPRRSSSSSLSPQRGPKDHKDFRTKVRASSPLSQRSPIRSVSPPVTGNRSAIEDRRSSSPYSSPARQGRERITHNVSPSPPLRSREPKPLHGSRDTSEEDEEVYNTREGGDYKSRLAEKRSVQSSMHTKQKGSPLKIHKHEDSHERSAGRRAVDSQSHLESRKNGREINSGKSSGTDIYPEALDGHTSPSLYAGGKKSGEGSLRQLSNANYGDGRQKSETKPVLVDKNDQNNGGGLIDSGSEESEKRRSENKEKRKHRRSHRQDVASDDENSDSSDIEDRKEAKRRRKEEKKLRKEEKRRRREERRRKKEERRSGKLKSRDRNDASSSDDERVGRSGTQPSNEEESQLDQKELEIELRKKALESLKAKKGISH